MALSLHVSDERTPGPRRVRREVGSATGVRRPTPGHVDGRATLVRCQRNPKWDNVVHRQAGQRVGAEPRLKPTGTSPIYTMQTLFNPGNPHPVPISQANVYGVVSLIFWPVMIIVTLTYVTLVMRADNDGAMAQAVVHRDVTSGIRGRPSRPATGPNRHHRSLDRNLRRPVRHGGRGLDPAQRTSKVTADAAVNVRLLGVPSFGSTRPGLPPDRRGCRSAVRVYRPRCGKTAGPASRTDGRHRGRG